MLCKAETAMIKRFGGVYAFAVGVAALGIAFAPLVPAAAATLNIETASIREVQAALATGKLSSQRLTSAYLARIAAYEEKGPAINAIILLNRNAMAEAKAMDEERRAGKVRGPLHGIPIVLKDNFNTADMPTTAGSQLLEGSIPPTDAFVVKKLREAGAVIVAKVNLGEFASSGGGKITPGFSSLGLQTHNPHDLARSPASSSGGTGSSIAAAFAQFGLGTDTAGSVRGPSSANGIVGLKTTHGLISRSGIIPYALSFDTVGPMARNVTDVAYALGILAGVDPTDPSTQKGVGKSESDYTVNLKPGALAGARIGVARQFMGADAGTDKITESAIATLKSLGAEVVDPIAFPDYLMRVRGPVHQLVIASEFKAQLTDYLQTLKPGFPRSFGEILAKANDPASNYRSPGKAESFKDTEARALDLNDPIYVAMKEHMIPAFTIGVDSVFAKYKVDAIFFPTSPQPAPLLNPDPAAKPAREVEGSANIANQSGFPEIVVPAGMTVDGLPVTISFLGRAFDEPRLIGYGYAFEQATHAIRLPKFTPPLKGDVLTY
jgi:amidase